jgi:hypothetical protein
MADFLISDFFLIGIYLFVAKLFNSSIAGGWTFPLLNFISCEDASYNF